MRKLYMHLLYANLFGVATRIKEQTKKQQLKKRKRNG